MLGPKLLKGSKKPLKASAEKNKTPIHVNGSFFLQFMMCKRCMCAFSGAPQVRIYWSSEKILIVLEVTTESKKDLVVKAKHIVAVIGMNRAKRKLKIVTKRDFIAVFFSSMRHIAS